MLTNDRLYLDESGDHATASAASTGIGKRYLGLVGVCFKPADGERFRLALESFKRRHLEYDDDDPPVLHREDIVARRGPFCILCDEERKSRFDSELVELIAEACYSVIAVVVDKVQHGRKRYRHLVHPYHYCLHAMMERYCGLLDLCNERGDVMAEARGAREDQALSAEYENVWKCGTRYCGAEKCQSTLTTKKLKLRRKEANVAGLQLADILAHPLTRDVLHAYGRIDSRGSVFADRICDVINCKYNRQVYSGRIDGYGRVILS